jgi:hypothetical protein
MAPKSHLKVPQQLAMTWGAHPLKELEARDREESLSVLAQLLLEAACGVKEEVENEDD